VIEEGLAAKLIETALGRTPVSLIRQTLSQSGNSIFRVALPAGGDVVLRVSRRPKAYAYTRQNLDRLRRLGLRVQSVLASGTTDEGGSFIVLNWLPGRDLVHELPSMSRSQKTHMADMVVDIQKRIGTLPTARGFGKAPIGASPGKRRWTDIFGKPPAEEETVDDASNPALAEVDRLRARLRRMRRSLEPYFAEIRPVCFLDDLTIRNVLAENGTLRGIIDVDFVCYGDPLLSVGTTLGEIVADVGEEGRYYGEELVRAWEPTPAGREAIRFYSALWVVGMSSEARTAGDSARADRLATAADSMLPSAAPRSGGTRMATADLSEQAFERHRAGDLREARRLYDQVLAATPGDHRTMFRSGLLELQEGRPEAALRRIEQAIEAAPEQIRYPLGLGETLAALGRWSEAATAYRRALAADAACGDAHFALGRALLQQADYRAAIDSFRVAVQLRPSFAEAFNNLGNCAQALGDAVQAESAYRRAIELQPDYAGAISNLGALFLAGGDAGRAIALFRRAAELEPTVGPHALNLGAGLCRQREFAEAAVVLGRLAAREPTNAEAAFNLGNALGGLHRWPEAAGQYQRATALRPDHSGAWNNLGNVRKQLGDFKQATAAYEAALSADPGSLRALNNLSCLLRTQRRFQEAETLLRDGLRRHDDQAPLWNNLGNVLKDSGRLDEAIECLRRSLMLDPSDAIAHSNLAYALTFQATGPEPILAEARRWHDRHASSIRPAALSRPLHRRLRIGYVSPDFRDHCHAMFTIPLLAHHDREAFEIYCYSLVERPDAHTERIARHADVWRNAVALDDAALCDQIRADEIDILVDLAMHMANGRPLVFARRAAPIQAAYLAYPGTTGIPAIDYRLTDPRLDPSGYDAHYTERSVRLRDSYWCYDPLTDEPAVSPLPARTRGFVTFGCLNNPCKITDLSLRLWAGVLHAVPDSQLLLMAPPGSGREHLLGRMELVGIAADRVRFVPFQPRLDYLRTYQEIDLGLDTFPYGGHTTSLDSFWMGVPVVSRVGSTCVGRAGLSQLHSLDLPELAADTDAEFVSAAVTLAADLPRLAALREGLRPRMERSVLMDATAFARNIEAAYRQMAAEHSGAQQRAIA
jgi:protein O-GlcNAc transferase